MRPLSIGRSLIGFAMFAALACAIAPAAWAGEGASSLEKGLSNAQWSNHPGAAIAAIVAIVLAGLLASAGIGCTIALLGVVIPRARDAVDAAARPASAGRMLVIGSLALGGVLFAFIGAERTGVPAISTTVAIVLGVPSLLLFLTGVLGGIPLLGERLLGPRGAEASPLKRSVTATVALGLAFLPSFALNWVVVGLLVGLVALAWPLGVGIQTARRCLARRP